MHLYGLIIGIAIIIGLQYFEKHNQAIPKKLLNTFNIELLLSLLFGARLYHVIDTWSYYSQYPNQILATWNGGLGIIGAIIAGFVFILVFSRINKIPIIAITDQIAPILPLCQSIGRFGNYINGEIPIWWLESLLCFFLFLFIKKFPRYPSAKYLIGYGLIRLITESFRSDTWIVNSFHVAHLISIIFVISGIILIKYQSRLHRLVA